jgi:hypothetical protein
MKEIALPVLALFAAVVGLAVAAVTSPLAFGVALATMCVALAVVYQYSKGPTSREEEIVLEDFSWWADIGEPAASLKTLKPDETWLASQIVSAELKSLSRNAELLGKRLGILIGRSDFKGLDSDFAHEAEKVSRSLTGLAHKTEKDKVVEPDVYKYLEQYATRLDRVANKLYEFKQAKSDLVHVYVDPLRRAAEKLSRDLRHAAANLFKYTKRAEPTG